jgi:lipid II:glycine glycyltransferase (peptidoglycan interpeptide bridge formation enzyme)
VSDVVVRAAQAADRDALDAFVVARPEADMLQLWAWGESMAVARQRPERLLATRGGEVAGAMTLLVRPTAMGRTVLYAPHGPVWDRDAPGAEGVLQALLDAARDRARELRGIVVKVDPRARPEREAAEGDDATDGSDAGQVAQALRAAGLRASGDDLQARTTRILRVDPDEEVRVAGWKKEARNKWRRAAREGTTARLTREADRVMLEAFHALLAQTAAIKHFNTRGREFYEKLAAELAAGGHLRLVLAEWNGQPIAVRFVAVLGDRAFSLYRATDRSVPRETYGHHAIMGALLAALADEGVTTMDMWGVAEPGDPRADPAWVAFSEFKLEFGGTPLAHPGTFDLVVDPFWYGVRALRERLGRRGSTTAEASYG